MFTVAVRLFSRETRKMYGHFFCIKLSSVNFSAPRKFGVNYNRTYRTLYIIVRLTKGDCKSNFARSLNKENCPKESKSKVPQQTLTMKRCYILLDLELVFHFLQIRFNFHAKFQSKSSVLLRRGNSNEFTRNRNFD